MCICETYAFQPNLIYLRFFLNMIKLQKQILSTFQILKDLKHQSFNSSTNLLLTLKIFKDLRHYLFNIYFIILII
jgi:hypothetical protein